MYSDILITKQEYINYFFYLTTEKKHIYINLVSNEITREELRESAGNLSVFVFWQLPFAGLFASTWKISRTIRQWVKTTQKWKVTNFESEVCRWQSWAWRSPLSWASLALFAIGRVTFRIVSSNAYFSLCLNGHWPPSWLMIVSTSCISFEGVAQHCKSTELCR